MGNVINSILHSKKEGVYVWKKQGMSGTIVEETTEGTYILTTSDDAILSSEIEYSSNAPIYDSSKRQWIFADSTIVTIVNYDDAIPSINGNIYCRVTSEPNVWYLVTVFSKGFSSPYLKSMTYSAKYTVDIDFAKKYLIDKVENTYPADGWLKDGYHYKQVINDPNMIDAGIIWTQSNITNRTFKSLCYGAGLWLAGSGGIIYSYDGINWEYSDKTTGTVTFLCYGGGIYVAGTLSQGLWYSTDGITWTQSNITNNASFRFICYSDGIFVASDEYYNGNSSNGIYYSVDGKTWTQSNITSGTFACVSHNDGIWVATGTTTNGVGSQGIYYSVDGKTWTQSNITSGTSRAKSICYENGTWVAVAWNNLYASTDGKNWEKISSYNQYYGFICNLNGIWVVSSTSSAAGTVIHWSTDLETFNMVTINASGRIYDLVTFNSKFIVASSEGIYYSTDGKTWAQSDENSFGTLCPNDSVIIIGAGNNNTSGLYYSESKLIEVDF